MGVKSLRALLALLIASSAPSNASAQLARAVSAPSIGRAPLSAPVLTAPLLPTPALAATLPAASLQPSLPLPAAAVRAQAGAVAAQAAAALPASAAPVAAAFAAPRAAAAAVSESGRSEDGRAPTARAQLEALAADPSSERLWTSAVPASQARAQLRRAHWQTFKFFFGSRVGLLRDMIRQQEAETAGRERAVKDLSGMWLAWRTKGYTGKVQTAGFETADRATVRKEAEKVYDRYFPKDAEAREAFHRLLDRVDAYVPERRPSNYRKLAFGTFYEAPTLHPSELKAKLESTLAAEHLETIARWRAERQDGKLAGFKAAALAAIREVNRTLPEGKKVVAVILLGSYSIGQSTPNSDVDFQLVTRDGGSDAIAPFKESLARNWTEDPVEKLEAFQFALPPSPEVVKDSFPEGYLVVSPDPAAVAALSFETAPAPTTAWTRARGKAFEWAYTAWIRAWFLAASAREFFSRR